MSDETKMDIGTTINVERLLEVVEEQRVDLINSNSVIREYEQQLTQANKTIMDLIQLNFDLKEEIKALTVENENVISDLNEMVEYKEKMDPIASIGGKMLNLFSEMNYVIEQQKYAGKGGVEDGK